MKKWHELPGETAAKDKPMDMTQENFYRVIAMRDDLIDEQRVEISKLKAKVNQLSQKIKSR
jgi:hypothetical protein